MQSYKRVILSVLLSFLSPGLGQFYNKEHKKGVILLLVSGILFLVPLLWIMSQVGSQVAALGNSASSSEALQSKVLDAVKKDSHILNLFSFAFLGVWAYSITQAYFRSKDIQEKENSTKDN